MEYSASDNDYQTSKKIQMHQTPLIERFTNVPSLLNGHERRKHQTTSDMKKCDDCGEYKITCTFRFPDAYDVMCWDCWRKCVLAKKDIFFLKALIYDLYEEYSDRDWRVNRFMWDINDRINEIEKTSSK